MNRRLRLFICAMCGVIRGLERPLRPNEVCGLHRQGEVCRGHLEPLMLGEFLTAGVPDDPARGGR